MVARKLISAIERFDVLERDGFRCVYCGKSAVDGGCLSVIAQVDHLFPRSKGGRDSSDNYVTACSDCNIGKGSRVLSSLPLGLPPSVVSEWVRANAPPEDQREIKDLIGHWDLAVLETLVLQPGLFVTYKSEFATVYYKSEIAREAVEIASQIVDCNLTPTFNDLACRGSGALCRALFDIKSDADRGWISVFPHERDWEFAFARNREKRELLELMEKANGDADVVQWVERMVAWRRKCLGMDC